LANIIKAPEEIAVNEEALRRYKDIYGSVPAWMQKDAIEFKAGYQNELKQIYGTLPLHLKTISIKDSPRKVLPCPNTDPLKLKLISHFVVVLPTVRNRDVVR